MSASSMLLLGSARSSRYLSVDTGGKGQRMWKHSASNAWLPHVAFIAPSETANDNAEQLLAAKTFGRPSDWCDNNLKFDGIPQLQDKKRMRSAQPTAECLVIRHGQFQDFRLIGWVQIRTDKALISGRSNPPLSLKLIKTNHDGPLLELRPEFSLCKSLTPERFNADAINIPEVKEQNRKILLNMLGDISYMQWAQHAIEHLNQAILGYGDAVREDPRDAASLVAFGGTLGDRFEQLNDLGDINDSVSALEKRAVYSLEQAKPFVLFQSLGNLDDLRKSLSARGEALRLSSNADFNKSAHLENLGISLLLQFEHLGDLDSIDRSVSLLEEALRLTPPGHPNRHSKLLNLGQALRIRFERMDDLSDLHRAILIGSEGVCITSDSHVDKASALNNQGVSLLSRFERLGNLDDLDDSIAMCENAVRLTSDGHHDRLQSLQDLGNSLSNRFQRLGHLDDLNQSISMRDDAVRLTPDDHPDKTDRLQSLGRPLCLRFERFSDVEDLQRSVVVQEESIRLSPEQHPNKPDRLGALHISLFLRFERFGKLADINHCIILAENVLEITPDGHPKKPGRLTQLGHALRSRFEHIGDLGDLNMSVIQYHKALHLTPDDHARRPVCLHSLGQALSQRFEQLAIFTEEESLALTPDEHPERQARLNNLATHLSCRFQKLGDPADLQRSCRLGEDAIRHTPDDHPDKPAWLLNHSIYLQSLPRRNPEDLQEVINHLRSAASSMTGPAHIRIYAAARWARLAQVEAHPFVLDAYRRSLELLPNLAWLGLSIKDRQYEIPRAGKGANSPGMAVEWLEKGRSITAKLKTIDKKKLRAQVRPHIGRRANFSSPPHWGQRTMHVISHAVDASSTHSGVTTPLDYQRLTKVLCKDKERTMEQQREVAAPPAHPGPLREPLSSLCPSFVLPFCIWGQLLNIRTPVDDLRQAHPQLADQFISLSTQLEGTGIRSSERETTRSSTQPFSLQPSHDQALQRNRLLEKIRRLAGFDRFMLPKRIFELSSAASGGPVVVLNLSDNRCDALALLPGVLDFVHYAENLSQSLRALVHGCGRHERLPGRREVNLNPEDVFAHILSELWIRLVKPVLDALNITKPSTHNLQRIWWCPTGSLTFLPIHAAGIYGANEVFGSKLSDFVISYTPSLTALIHGFRPRSQSQKPFQVLAVAQPSAQGQAYIPGTKAEITSIQKHATGKVPVLRLNASMAKVGNVQAGMRDSSWVHFACHGTQNGLDPTESALLLAGSSRLTLSNIIKFSLPEVQEEAVHLAGGMLSAGYRGVIATMWTIMDSDAPQVASDVYERLFQTSPPDSRRAAEALHHAVRRLREESDETKSFSCWVPFIHVGV
ncbi:CHAT domain-containing protein [Mycena capillaripes]|nr:CHAT domain-containing protein [Mycena capillaripes]